MSSDSKLYEQVWGEPRPTEAKATFSSPPAAQPETRHLPKRQAQSHSGILPNQTSRLDVLSARSDAAAEVDDGFARRLDAIEEALHRIEHTGTETRNLVEKSVGEIAAVVSEIHESILRAKESNDSQTSVLSALHVLETRMIRTEKGLVRTLEYFESKLAAQAAAAKSTTLERAIFRG